MFLGGGGIGKGPRVRIRTWDARSTMTLYVIKQLQKCPGCLLRQFNMADRAFWLLLKSTAA